MLSEKRVMYLNYVVYRTRVGILRVVLQNKISTHVYGSSFNCQNVIIGTNKFVASKNVQLFRNN
jgi:hypothetical protein